VATHTIPAALARAASDYAGTEAIVDGGVRWTFAELADNVYRCAGALTAAGVRPGDRVAIWAPNSHRFVVAALGAVTAGAALVPLNTRFKAEEAEWILAKSRPVAVLVDNGFLGADYVAMLPASGPRVIRMDQDWDSFVSSGSAADGTAAGAAVDDSDVADMFFTSGTTGKPKGVLSTHEQDIRVFTAWADGVGLRPRDRYLIVNPMFHTFGYKAGILACLIRGATMIPRPVFDVQQVLRLIEAERVTVFPGPPTIYASMLDHPELGGSDLSSLRLAVTGAAMVPVRLIERVRENLFPEVVIAYGLTESCGTVTIGSPNGDPAVVGKAIEGTEVSVAGGGPGGPGGPGGSGRAGEAGEVLVRGYNVMHGYFEDEAATRAAIDAEGWLHTGDVGVLDADGNLRITDRLKDMYTVGGFNVYPAEIEQVLARHDGVAEVAVVGVPDERLGAVGRAYVVPRPGSVPAEDELIGFCRERLANFKVPRTVRLVDSLPRNASGKVLKYQLTR